MKKILMLNPYFPTMGGGEKNMALMCKFIEEYFPSVTIDILVHTYNQIDIWNSEYPTIETLKDKFNIELKKTKLVKIDLSETNSRLDQFNNKRKIEEITTKYDIFINHMFLSKHIGKAIHNIYLCMFPPTKSNSSKVLNRIAWEIFDKRFIKSYELFLPISEFTDRWLDTYWGKYGINKTILYPPSISEKDVISEDKITDKENLILAVGRFFVGGHNKKQQHLVRFFKNNREKLGSYELHLVGAVADCSADIDYLNTIKSEADGANIVFHNNIEHEELARLYEKARIFWHATGFEENEEDDPIRMEHFGITTVEAMSYGAIPVVISKGGQTEIVEHGKSGYLWSNESECIEYTVKCINDESMMNKMSLAAIERSKHFSEQMFYKRLEGVFSSFGNINHNSQL